MQHQRVQLLKTRQPSIPLLPMKRLAGRSMVPVRKVFDLISVPRASNQHRLETPTDTGIQLGIIVVVVRATDSANNTSDQSLTISVSDLDALYPSVVFDPSGEVTVGSSISLDQIGSAPITIQSVQFRDPAQEQLGKYFGRNKSNIQLNCKRSVLLTRQHHTQTDRRHQT